MGLFAVKIAPVVRHHHHGAIEPPALIRRMVIGVRAQPDSASAVTKAQLMAAVFNWSLCLLLMFLLLSQSLTVVLSSSKNSRYLLYGRNPSLGTYAISGYNDEPYSDRLLVCRRRERRFDVLSVNEALSNPATYVEGTSSLILRGYRVVNRSSMILSDSTRRLYVNTCSRLNSTMERIFSICSELGYLNITRDTLRIVDDVYSSRLHVIPDSLPVLIMPFWDNAASSRYVIPGWDGHACMFRLGGRYEVADAQRSFLFAVNRTVRESKTEEWLGKSRAGGVWKNGWYEDPEGMRWYSDIVSTNTLNPVGPRRFDMIEMIELDCVKEKVKCVSSVTESHWGNLVMSSNSAWINSVAISNGARYGLFLFESSGFNIVTCIYNTAIFTSDMSFAWLLLQWMLSMIAVQRGFFKRVSAWHNTDIGCLANSYSFAVLIITTLPRAKMIIAAFCTCGCAFEGSQRALSEAWFVIYPAIVNMVLLHSSILNVLAKIFRRRMSSRQIPVTIMFLSFMHWQRAFIGSSNWFGFDGRLATLVTPEEFKAMSLFEVLKPSTSLRLNGNIKALLAIKLMALFLNTLPMLFSQDMSLKSKQSQAHASCECEKILSVRACNVGGLGRSGLYELHSSSARPRLMLNAYEIVRLGYIVVGDRYLMTWESWILLVAVALLRRVRRLRNHRIMVFDVETTNTDGRAFSISTHPQLINLNDPRLLSIKLWNIDSRALL